MLPNAKAVKFFLIILCAAIILPGAALAHGAVTTQSADVGSYTIEFEYDTLGAVYNRTDYNYSFRLLDKKTKQGAAFSSVYAEFIRPRFGISGSANLHPIDTGYASMGLALPDADQYTVNITFYSQSQQLAKNTFTLNVQPNPAFAVKKSWLETYLWLWTLVAGCASGYLIGRRLKRAN